MLEFYRDDLARLDAAHRRRRLAGRGGVDFASNDYLALRADPRLADAARAALARGVGVGAGGSRLLRGNDAEHEALEAEAAAFFGSEAALFLANGFAANLAIFGTLPQRGDLVVHDALIHASAHDGMRLGRAECRAMPHNDVGAADAIIADWRRGGGTGRVWIAVEAVYSMEGTRAPIDALLDLARAHDAFLIVDEAHATGVFGEGGRGLAPHGERERVVALHTCGKALGVEGALITCAGVLREFLVNRGRSFIFTTAPSPLIAAVVRESLRIVADEPARRARLHALIEAAGAAFAPLGVPATGTQIVPVVLGEDARAMRVAAAAQAAGFDVRGIRPPTVPAGTARLRISLTLNATAADVAALADVLKEAM